MSYLKSRQASYKLFESIQNISCVRKIFYQKFSLASYEGQQIIKKYRYFLLNISDQKVYIFIFLAHLNFSQSKFKALMI